MQIIVMRIIIIFFLHKVGRMCWRYLARIAVCIFNDPIARKNNSQNCDIVFVNNYHLREHLMIHTWENSYQCSECDKIFSNDSILTSHLRVLNVCFISDRILISVVIVTRLLKIKVPF